MKPGAIQEEQTGPLKFRQLDQVGANTVVQEGLNNGLNRHQTKNADNRNAIIRPTPPANYFLPKSTVVYQLVPPG